MIPKPIPVPAAFERVGHLVHLNLSEEQRRYGQLIGEVILDVRCFQQSEAGHVVLNMLMLFNYNAQKHSGVRTIVNKRAQVSSEFRTFQLELLAGEDNYVTSMV